MTTHQAVQLFIAGRWTDGLDSRSLHVFDPASGQAIGGVAIADGADMERAVESSIRGFRTWSSMLARERGKVLDRAANGLQARAEELAHLITREQGKPLAEARSEVVGSVEVIRWFAEESRRIYGRTIAPRHPDVAQLVLRQPVGPVAAFTPWNYPVSQAVRKLAAALAAGCSVILKGAEETPSSIAALVQVFVEAGLPPDTLNLLFGRPAEISEFLVPHPAIRAISFTGSTAVGKQLSAMAGAHMKRVTMELGGHAPAIVCDDADLPQAAAMLAAHKFHNAGQSCIAPTRILVQTPVFDEFCELFVAAARRLKVGPGCEDGVDMGPMANDRRIDAMQKMTQNAVAGGARILCGGKRVGIPGAFWQPTVLSNVNTTSMAMNEEPFGPLALVNAFEQVEDALTEANRLSFALAAYGFTRSQRTAALLASHIEAGMVSINEYGLAYAEVPFNGIKDSGFGSEGGTEAMESFLNTKFVSQRNI